MMKLINYKKYIYYRLDLSLRVVRYVHIHYYVCEIIIIPNYKKKKKKKHK